MAEQLVVGVDVSKARLDVAISPSGEQFTVSNDRLGVGSPLPFFDMGEGAESFRCSSALES